MVEARNPVRIFLMNSITILPVVAAALVLFEFGLRLFYPAVEQYYVYLPNSKATFEAPASIHGVQRLAQFSVNSAGYRGDEVDPTDVQMLAIGGSTTQNNYLDDTKTWTHLLSRALSPAADNRRVWVGNAGVSGHNTGHHFVQANYLLPQEPEVDTVLMLVGVNDLTVALAQGDQFQPVDVADPEAAAEFTRSAFALIPAPMHAPQTVYMMGEDPPGYKNLALYQLAKKARMGLTAMTQSSRTGTFGQALQTWRDRRQSGGRISQLPDMTPVLENYRANLEAIIDVVQQNGRRLVFVTQPTIWRADLAEEDLARLWMGGLGEDFMLIDGSQYYDVASLAQAMSLYNSTLLDVCESRAVECIDVAAAIPKTAEMFYDDVHFTEAGAQRVADTIATYFLSRGL